MQTPRNYFLKILLLGILIAGLSPQIARAAPLAKPHSPWQPQEVIADRMQCTTNPSVDTDASGTVYVMWCDLSADLNGYDVFFRYRTADGSWSPAEVASATREWNQEYPDLDVTPTGDAYTVWRHKDLSTYPPVSLLRFRKRKADGTWGATELIANEQDEERSIEVTVDGTGNAYVVWYQYPFNGSYTDSVTKVRVRNSNGVWDAIETVAQGMYKSVVTDSQGNLYILVEDLGPDQVYLHHRSSSGVWSAPELIGDPGVDPYKLGFGKEGKLYALLKSDDGTRWLRYRASDGNWEPPIDLAHDGKQIHMAIDESGNGYAYWASNYELYTAYRWQDGTWGSPVHVTSYQTTYPQLTMTPSGGRFFLIWEGDHENLYLSYAEAPGDAADLSASGKYALPQDIHPGDRADYTFTIHNTGKNTAITLTDTLPLSTTLIPGSAWADEGAITATTQSITWTAVSSYSTMIEAGFAVTVSDGIDLHTPVVISNTGYLSDGTDTLTLTHALIVNPKLVYLPMVLRSQ
jgi:uncharacterized repeat protein (TIGR01451 family)